MGIMVRAEHHEIEYSAQLHCPHRLEIELSLMHLLPKLIFPEGCIVIRGADMQVQRLGPDPMPAGRTVQPLLDHLTEITHDPSNQGYQGYVRLQIMPDERMEAQLLEDPYCIG